MKLSKRASLWEQQLLKRLNETKTANRKTLFKWVEEIKENPKQTKLNYPLTEEEKWETFFKYVKIYEEDPTVSKQQFEDFKLLLEKVIWGDVNR